jgi:hypothetical protein
MAEQSSQKKQAVPTSPPPASGALVAAAGEHYVLHKLFRRGLLAALAPRNEPNFDVLVFGTKADVVATIQVKARRRGADKGWMMRRKHEQLTKDGLFYAFVDLEGEDTLVSYVMTSSVVAETLKATHARKLFENKPLSTDEEETLRSRLDERGDLLTRLAGWTDEEEVTAFDETKARVVCTSLVGSKGLSAQHVFLVGAKDGDFPRDPASIDRLEVCQLIVGGGHSDAHRALFIGWLGDLVDHKSIDPSYW